MKRRTFFATLLAPLLAPFLPKPKWVATPEAGQALRAVIEAEMDTELEAVTADLLRESVWRYNETAFKLLNKWQFGGYRNEDIPE